MTALILLNWEFLNEEPLGIALFAATATFAIGTLVFYLLTGVTDPGFVRNQIFENAYETTEFVEEEE